MTQTSAAVGPICYSLNISPLTILACLDPGAASITLAKLQNPVKQSFDQINNDLKEVYKGLGNYSKALDKVVDCSTFNRILSNQQGSRSSKANRYPRRIMMLYPLSHP